eukprot:COSAG01_NODE_8346_length_2821_cov_6.530125_4_plen_128_part_00
MQGSAELSVRIDQSPTAGMCHKGRPDQLEELPGGAHKIPAIVGAAWRFVQVNMKHEPARPQNQGYAAMRATTSGTGQLKCLGSWNLLVIDYQGYRESSMTDMKTMVCQRHPQRSPSHTCRDEIDTTP